MYFSEFSNAYILFMYTFLQSQRDEGSNMIKNVYRELNEEEKWNVGVQTPNFYFTNYTK